jgi:hypothetical protein
MYYEDAKSNKKDKKKKGRIKMDMLELPLIDPRKISSADGFAES